MKKIIKCGQLFTAEDESVQHNMCIVIEDNIIIDTSYQRYVLSTR